MRIACLHLPQFALQCATRIDPSLRGAPVVVVGAAITVGLGGDAGSEHARASMGGVLHGPVVLACSRAAWALGARVGMTAPAARGLSPELRVVSADPQLERETVRAIADALLGLSAVVDLGGRVGPSGTHLAMYCEVPGKMRGTSFAEKVIERLGGPGGPFGLGVTARIGIADDRFTAWVAAAFGPAEHETGHPPAHSARSAHSAHAARSRLAQLAHPAHPAHMDTESSVTSVPRGGSAAFLAPRPLSLLAITPEVQHMLESLGVATLGEFAALPAPSVARPLEADYQALARGESGHVLRPYTPEAPVREELAISAGMTVPAAVAVLAERVALRLSGRGRGAARLEVSCIGEAGERTVPVDLVTRNGVIGSAEELAEAIGSALGDHGPVWRLRVLVAGEALAPAAYDQAVVEEGAGATGLAAGSGPVAAPPALDTLVLVLSNSGSWNLTSPALRAERRDAHHRIERRSDRPNERPTMSWRRGKRRRDAESSHEALVQPRLFKNLP